MTDVEGVEYSVGVHSQHLLFSHDVMILYPEYKFIVGVENTLKVSFFMCCFSLVFGVLAGNRLATFRGLLTCLPRPVLILFFLSVFQLYSLLLLFDLFPSGFSVLLLFF